jgi:hypothetical protein
LSLFIFKPKVSFRAERAIDEGENDEGENDERENAPRRSACIAPNPLEVPLRL